MLQTFICSLNMFSYVGEEFCVNDLVIFYSLAKYTYLEMLIAEWANVAVYFLLVFLCCGSTVLNRERERERERVSRQCILAHAVKSCLHMQSSLACTCSQGLLAHAVKSCTCSQVLHMQSSLAHAVKSCLLFTVYCFYKLRNIILGNSMVGWYLIFCEVFFSDKRMRIYVNISIHKTLSGVYIQ